MRDERARPPLKDRNTNPGPARMGTEQSDQLTLVLPPAPPDHYMRWMAFWREVEQQMLRSPSLEEFASAQSAPFMHDPVARLLSNVAVTQVTRQAEEAMALGKAE